MNDLSLKLLGGITAASTGATEGICRLFRIEQKWGKRAVSAVIPLGIVFGAKMMKLAFDEETLPRLMFCSFFIIAGANAGWSYFIHPLIKLIAWFKKRGESVG